MVTRPGHYGLSLTLGLDGAGGAPAVAANTYFANETATLPWYADAVGEAGFYYPTRDQTYIGFESNIGDSRVSRASRYSHAPLTWGRPNAIFLSDVVNDEHGVPAGLIDYEGYAHWFGGAHGTANLRHSVETFPGSNRYIPNPDVTGISWGYPHPNLYNNQIHLYARNNGSGRMEAYYTKTTALSGGVATWGSLIKLIDLGDDSRVYFGNHVQNGVDNHMVWCRADLANSQRRHAYYAIMDQSTGILRNYAGDVTVAAGNTLDAATADASFRVFVHASGHGGQIPQIAFDDGGFPVISVQDITGTAPAHPYDAVVNLYVVTNTGGGWVQSALIGQAHNFYEPITLGVRGALVDLYWGDDPAGLNGAYQWGGNMYRATRTGGVWGAATLLMTPERSYSLSAPLVIKNGKADLRAAWGEIDVTGQASGGLNNNEMGDGRVYAYGDAGIVRRAAETLWHPSMLGTKLYAWLAAADGYTGRRLLDRRSGEAWSPQASPVGADATFATTERGVTFAAASSQYYSGPGGTGFWPTGSTPCDIVAVFNATASSTTKVFVGYGASSGAAQRVIQVNGTTGFLTFSDGVTGVVDALSCTGLPIQARGRWSGTTLRGWKNGTELASSGATIATLATGTTRRRLGSNAAVSAGGFFNGVGSDLFIGNLTDAEAMQLEGWVAWNRGAALLTALRADHPYKSAAPLA